MTNKKLFIHREALKPQNPQSLDLDYEKIFSDIPEDHEIVYESEKYFINGSDIVFTAEIRKKAPASEFVEIMIR